jgi:hypothetical protein
MGCRALWGQELPLSEKAADALAVFDLKVREYGYLLLPFNDRRMERLLWMAPETQKDFWWWERGIAIRATCCGPFSMQPKCYNDFPEAEKFLMDLRDGLESIDSWMQTAKSGVEEPFVLQSLLTACQQEERLAQHPPDSRN